jgi:cobalt-zinc-cadmium efflux system membrane fusion protein
MIRRSVLILTGLALAASAAGCGDKHDSAEASAAPEAKKEDHLLRLEAQMARSVRTEELTETRVPVTIKTFGKIQFNEDQVAFVLAPLPGHVVNLAVKVGSTVRAGDVLFQIRSRDVTAVVGEVNDSRKDLELSERTFAMTRDLFESQAASKIALKQAENDVAKARGRLARAQAVLKTLGMDPTAEEVASLVPVRSPIDGTVTDRKVTEGQYETADSNALLTIANLSSVWIVADLFERDLARAAVGQKAEIQTVAYPDRTFTGQVTRISDVVDPNTRTVKVRVQVPNPDGRLKPEMFASILLFLQESPALTIPTRAAFIEGGKYFVYLQKSDATFERIPVAVQPAPDGRLRVLDGLRAGEKVVSEDVMLLRAQEAGDSK